jgi:CRP-like cAMP-binding protein
MTLTTVGYGDIAMMSDGERVFAIFCMFCGAVLFAIVMSNTNQVLRELNASNVVMTQRMDSINMYMQHRQLPQELKTRIRKYYAFYWSRQSVFDEAAVLSALPSHLRREVLLYLHRDMISKVPFFREAETSFILNLVSCLTPVMAAPGDFVMIAGELGLEMYFIDYGRIELWSASMATRYSVLEPGHFFGEDALITRERRTANARAVGYAELWSLSRPDLDCLVVDSPEMAGKMEVMARERLQSQLEMEENAPKVIAAFGAQHGNDAPRGAIRGQQGACTPPTSPGYRKSRLSSQFRVSLSRVAPILEVPGRGSTGSGGSPTGSSAEPRYGAVAHNSFTSDETMDADKLRQKHLSIMQRSLQKISPAKLINHHRRSLRACSSVREESVRDAERHVPSGKGVSPKVSRLDTVESSIVRLEKMQQELMNNVVSVLGMLKPGDASSAASAASRG